MIGAIKVISGTAHPELAEAICKCLGADLCRTTVVRFSNENMLVRASFASQPISLRQRRSYVTTCARAVTSRTTCSSPATWVKRKMSATTRPA